MSEMMKFCKAAPEESHDSHLRDDYEEFLNHSSALSFWVVQMERMFLFGHPEHFIMLDGWQKQSIALKFHFFLSNFLNC